MLVLRPIFVLALCDLYSDYLNEKGVEIELPENPAKSVSAIVAFGCLCLILGVIYMYRVELGVVDMLSTPYGQEYQPSRSEEHTSELQSRPHLVCRLLLEKKKTKYI